MRMAIKRIVSTEFWTDKKVVEQFTPEDKLFFLYLLTNPHTTQIGIYPFITKIAAFEIGYSTDTIVNLVDRFERYGIVKYSQKSGEIAVKNYLKHSIVKGGTPVYDLLKKEAGQIKDKVLLDFVLSSNADNPNDTVRQFVSDFTNDNDNDNDNDESYHESYHESSEPKQSEIKKQPKRFIPPSLQEVKDYAASMHLDIDPAKFMSYYTASDWHDSQGKKVRNWKQKAITWSGRGKKPEKKSAPTDADYEHSSSGYEIL